MPKTQTQHGVTRCVAIDALLLLHGLVALATAASSGKVSLCSTEGQTWGCTRFVPGKNDGEGPGRLNRNGPDDCIENKGIMWWATAPEASAHYSLRSGDGADPGEDQLAYVPGEITLLYLKVLEPGLQFRGVLCSAVALRQGNKTVGSWIFPAEERPQLYQSPPACPSSLTHISAEPKPYTSVLRFEGPPAGTGDIVFQTLLKQGPANTGHFFTVPELRLIEATPAPKKRTSWLASEPGQSCSEACAAKGLGRCQVAEMRKASSGAKLSGLVSSTYACALPIFSSCALGGSSATSAPATTAGGRCYYHDACAAETSCDAKSGKERRFCACGTSSRRRALRPSRHEGEEQQQEQQQNGDKTEGAQQPKTRNFSPLPGHRTGTGTDTGADSGAGATTSAATRTHAASRLLSLGMLVGLSSARRSFVGLGALLVFAVLLEAPATQAHNWFLSESRATKIAQGMRPCRSRVGDEFHVQVGPGQPFTIAWATGHQEAATVTLLRAEDLDMKKHGNYDGFQRSVQEYIAEAPVGSNLAFTKPWRRMHGSFYDFDAATTHRGAKLFAGRLVERSSPEWHMSKRVSEEVDARDGTVKRKLYTYPLDHVRQAGDVRFDYRSTKHPWILMVWRSVMSYSDFQDFDQLKIELPPGAPPGHYVLQWDWNGYYDCVDVELRSEKTLYPYGKGSSAQVFKRIDHCQYENYDRIATGCHFAAPSVDQCIGRLVDHYPGFRLGINAVPVVLPDAVPDFLRRHTAPWREQLCGIGEPVRLGGTVTESVPAAAWKAEWLAKTDTRPQTGCAGEVLFTASSLREAIQSCSDLECVGIARYAADNAAGSADGVYRGCKATAAVAAGGADDATAYLKKTDAASRKSALTTGVQGDGYRCRVVDAATQSRRSGRSQTMWPWWWLVVFPHLELMTRHDCEAQGTKFVAGPAGNSRHNYPSGCVYSTTQDTFWWNPTKGVGSCGDANGACAFKDCHYSAVLESVPVLEHVATISFEPAGMTYGLPAKTHRDTGEMYGARGGSGLEYGWTTCAHKWFGSGDSWETTRAEWLFATCKVGATKPGYGCFTNNPDPRTGGGYHENNGGWSSTEPYEGCARNKWEMGVANGFYKISLPLERAGGPDQYGSKVKGCTVEGVRLSQQEEGGKFGGGSNVPTLQGPNEPYSLWLEVADGKITLEDLGDFGKAGPYSCSSVGWLKVERLDENSAAHPLPPPVWFPSSSDPWWQLEVDGEGPQPIGFVAVRQPDPFTDCRSQWLFGGSPEPRCLLGNFPQGYFDDAATTGLVVGVSNSSCTGTTCPVGHVCGRIYKPLHGSDNRRGLGGQKPQMLAQHVKGQVHVESELDYEHVVDCGGVLGRYVYVQAPGSGRILPVTFRPLPTDTNSAPYPPGTVFDGNEDLHSIAGMPREDRSTHANRNPFIMVHRSEPLRTAANQGRYLCYGVNTAGGGSEATPEYYTTTDPEDPAFYSTCYARVPNVEYLPPEGAGDSRSQTGYVFNGRCLECGSLRKNQKLLRLLPAPNSYANTPNASASLAGLKDAGVPRYEWADRCMPCEADTPQQCMVTTTKCSSAPGEGGSNDGGNDGGTDSDAEEAAEESESSSPLALMVGLPLVGFAVMAAAAAGFVWHSRKQQQQQQQQLSKQKRKSLMEDYDGSDTRQAKPSASLNEASKLAMEMPEAAPAQPPPLPHRTRTAPPPLPPRV